MGKAGFCKTEILYVWRNILSMEFTVDVGARTFLAFIAGGEKFSN